MEAKKLFFKGCHLAGRQYHEADEVWDKLHVGTLLKLVRDRDNKYDPHAVAVMLEGEDIKKEYLLGYVPSDQNKDIAKLLEMGWDNIFECRISKINANTHYENQIGLTIRIKKNETK